MKFKIQNLKFKIKETGFDIDDLIKALLFNRGIKTKKEIEEFLNPKLESVTTRNVGINSKELQKAITRMQKAIKNKEKIVVFGDYDVDGICGTAILWETLNSLGARAMPYIPHRVEEGYGLSVKGIQNVIMSSHPELGSGSRFRNKFGMTNNQVQHDNKKKLIITVDNGIVANKAVEFANEQGINVIITDHHVPSKKLPKAYAIVHTTKLCGAGVVWMLTQEIENRKLKIGDGNGKWKMENGKYLELVTLATVADLVPLIGANRTLVKFGLEQLRQTKRVGLLELFKEAVLDKNEVGVYEIGHVIAPRLNAMGRLDYAMDSLRLLCTNNRERAKKLADTLGSTNKERQALTIETTEHAKSEVRSQKLEVRRLLFVSDESYQQGVIGLVAGKLVEEFYRPAIVVSKGEKYSKASARSVSGFNIIEFIRGASELLVDAGGHPMAAGFTVETSKLSILQKTLEEKAEELLDEEKLTRTLRIDCELPLSIVDSKLYQDIQKLSPFGMGNPEPTFVSRNVEIEEMRLVGAERRHIKFRFKIYDLRFMIDGIGFGMGERANEFRIGDKVDVVYTIDKDEWNGNERLQLKVKDLRRQH